VDYDALALHAGSAHRDNVMAALLFPGPAYWANTECVIKIAGAETHLLFKGKVYVQM